MTMPSERPMSRISSFMAHAIPAVIVASIGLHLLYLLGLNALEWYDTGLSFFLLLSIVALGHHLIHGGLCLRCVKSSPLDPQTEVRRHKLFLKFEHRTHKQFWVMWLACMAISLVGGKILGNWANLPIDVLWFSMMWGMWIHHRLQPWCPYCRGWDEGGDPELVPDPDPAETKRA